ncbi:hypothetical protein HPB47_021692 [Ixodes persulcatus]|uniref:Uncharacterized protein n=1 Tax=Ixodes persulcatus TaxID=34615 RepID=A0AC60QBU8_IXOPE|nr:hypothetical protein HPB47_021692 [Ixodes persulcatus]
MPKLEAFAGEEGEKWEEYVEVLEQHFMTHDVAADKQCGVLSSCGRPTYSLLRRLLAPKRPSEVPLDESSRLLTEHYSPRPSVIVQRYYFYCRAQKEGKAMKDFVAELQKLAGPCAFGQELDNNLRDQLVHGIRDDTTGHTGQTGELAIHRASKSEEKAAAVAQTEDADVLEPRVPPICASMTVQSQSVRVVVDAGAAYSVMDEAEFARRFSGTVLKQSDVELRGYFGHHERRVWRKAGPAASFVVGGRPWALLGRNWATTFGMPLGSLLDVRRVDGTDDLMGKFPELFSEGLGTLRGIKARIRVPEEAKLRFLRPRAVPFALQVLVAQKIQRLERGGISSPVRTSEWAE